MKNKKETFDEKFPKVLIKICAVLAIIIVFGGLLFIRHKFLNKFDPNKHDCNEWEPEYYYARGTHDAENRLWKIYNCEENASTPNCKYIWDYWDAQGKVKKKEKECVDRVNKPKEVIYCNKNPDDKEKCVCDEEIFERENVSVWEALFFKTEENKCTFDIKYHKDGLYFEGELIRNESRDKNTPYGTVWCDTPIDCKVRPKTECEKNNSNYILDAKCPKEDIIHGEFEIFCTSGWVEFCREKTTEEKYEDYLNEFDCDILFHDMAVFKIEGLGGNLHYDMLYGRMVEIYTIKGCEK